MNDMERYELKCLREDEEMEREDELEYYVDQDRLQRLRKRQLAARKIFDDEEYAEWEDVHRDLLIEHGIDPQELWDKAHSKDIPF